MVDRAVDLRVDQLASASVFRQFEPATLAALAETATQRRFAENTTLVRLGDVPSFIYVITQGKIRLSVPLSDGREFIYSDLGPGKVFDLSSFFVTRHSTMNAASLLETDVLQIDAAFATCLFEKHPELAHKVIPFFCQAAQAAEERVIEATAPTLSVRLASTILRITEEPLNSSVLDAGQQRLRVSQTDLAAMVPASREKVNRCLREWKRRALVQYDHGLLTILDRGALTCIAVATGWYRAPQNAHHRNSVPVRPLHGYT
jgi:CRP-like cAMP-binding protein